MSDKVITRTTWIYCAWPGLAQLWKKGAVAGLVLAVGFAVLLNLALVVSFGWTELLSSSARTITWLVVLFVWLTAGAASYVQLRREAAKRQAPSDGEQATDDSNDLFIAATNEYLQGNWYEVERLLDELLRRDSGDVEVRLMWATMCRHTGRLEEARRRLEELSLRERAESWLVEIGNEQRLIEREFARIRELDEEPITTITSSQTNTAA